MTNISQVKPEFQKVEPVMLTWKVSLCSS